MIDKKGPVYNLKQFDEIINELKKSGYVFRGLSDYNYEQIPTILFDSDKEDFRHMENENDDVQKLRNISKEYNINFMTLYEVARHYGFISRMVDYSTDPYISLYFACKDKHGSVDKKIICFDRYNYYQDNKNETDEGKQILEDKMGNLYLELLDNDVIQMELEDENGTMGSYRFKNPIFIEPVAKDDRINKQNGVFLLWPDICHKEQVLKYLNKYCKEVIIDSYSSKSILEDLDKRCYNRESIEKPKSTSISYKIIRKIKRIVMSQKRIK